MLGSWHGEGPGADAHGPCSRSPGSGRAAASCPVEGLLRAPSPRACRGLFESALTRVPDASSSRTGALTGGCGGRILTRLVLHRFFPFGPHPRRQVRMTSATICAPRTTAIPYIHVVPVSDTPSSADSYGSSNIAARFPARLWLIQPHGLQQDEHCNARRPTTLTIRTRRTYAALSSFFLRLRLL